MYGMNSGYNGYSMSNRAVEAYENGEKPLSRWRKADMINAISEIDEEKAAAFAKVRIAELKSCILTRSSWHHTSNRCNRTDFYSIDFDLVRRMSLDDIAALSKKERPAMREPVRRLGTIKYLEWSGTRAHPRATECCLRDVYIEEKGCYYIVTDKSGKQLLRKKIDSNGTFVTYDN